MKKILLLTLCILSLNLFAQKEKPKVFVWTSFGMGESWSPMQSHLIDFKGGLHTVIGEENYFSFQWISSINKSFIFSPNKIALQSVKYVNYGKRNKIRNSIYFTPAIGLGIANYTLTRFYKENTNEFTSFFADLILLATNKTIYDTYSDKSLCIPINLNFDFTGRFAGLGLGMNMIIMKYPSVGVSGSFLLGKIRSKKV